MNKKYYLTHLTFAYSILNEHIELTQLAYASSKEKAREAVAKEFYKEKGNNKNYILIGIRVDDTIIGE